MAAIVSPPTATPAIEQEKVASIIVAVSPAPAPTPVAPPGFKLVKIKRDGKIITVKRPITEAASTTPAVLTRDILAAKTGAELKPNTNVLATTSKPTPGAVAASPTPTSTPITAPTPAKAVVPAKAQDIASIPAAQISTPPKVAIPDVAAPAKPATASAPTPVIAVVVPSLNASTSAITPEKPAVLATKPTAAPLKAAQPTVVAATTTPVPTTSTPTPATKPSSTAPKPPASKTSASTPAAAPAPAPIQAPPPKAEAATKLKWYKQLAKVDVTKIATGIANTATSVEVMGNAVTRIGAVLTGDTAALGAAKAAAAKPATTAPVSQVAARASAGTAAPGQKPVLATTQPQQFIIASTTTAPAGGTAKVGPTTILLSTPTQANDVQHQPVPVVLQTLKAGPPVATTQSVSNVRASAPATTQRSVAGSTAAGSTGQAAPSNTTPGVVLGDAAAAVGLATVPSLVQAASHPAGPNALHTSAMPRQDVSRDAPNTASYNEPSEYERSKHSNHEDASTYSHEGGRGGLGKDIALIGGGAIAGGVGMEIYEDYVEGDDIIEEEGAEDPNSTNSHPVGADSTEAYAAPASQGYPAEQSLDADNEGDDENIEEYNPETDEVYDGPDEENAGEEVSNEEEGDEEVEEYNPETDEPWDGDNEDQEGGDAQHHEDADDGDNGESGVLPEGENLDADHGDNDHDENDEEGNDHEVDGQDVVDHDVDDQDAHYEYGDD